MPFLQLSQVFTPRLRGCTQERRASDFAAAIYPAPAGMYLSRFHFIFSFFDLPRACGDVPICIDPAYKEQGFTPRLRGCTQALTPPSMIDAIYPAPAGVYLLAVCCTDFSGDLPRACGDIPPTENKRQHGLRFTPRLRGCTCTAVVRLFPAGIYPAPAGMYQHRKRGGPNQLAIPATWGCSYATPAKFANAIITRRRG